MPPDGVSAKYVELISQCYDKYKNVSVVDSQLRPVPEVIDRKRLKNEILEQAKINTKVSVKSEKKQLLTNVKPLLRRRRKLIVSSSCKKKLHSINFDRTINYFTAEEDQKIIEAIEASKGKRLMISKLCKTIDRPYHSTRDRVRKLRNESSERNTKRFTIIEDKIILDEILQYIGQEKLREIPLPNPMKLSHLLKRRETSLKSRWQYYLKPMLLQYYTKTLNLDIRQMLVNHLASKYKSLETVDWEKVITDRPEFAGHTDSSIKYQFMLVYHLLRYHRKKKKSSLTLGEISKLADKIFEKREVRFSTKLMEHKISVITYFEKYVRQHGIDNFL